jgi:hypothetical protein
MGATTGAYHIARDSLGFVACRIIMHANPCSGSTEAACYSRADAATGARHQAHLVLEILGRHDLSPYLVPFPTR